MKLNFIKANPTENMTIFVLDDLPRTMYSDVAQKLMNYNSLCAEQVGFFEKPQMPGSTARLHMMGGEFCGNASRAFAAVLVNKNAATFRQEADRTIVPIEVSGCEEVLDAEVRVQSEQTYEVKIRLPLHKSAKSFETRYNGAHYDGMLVEFEGISHLILHTNGEIPDEGLLLHIYKEHGLQGCGAFGVMFYSEGQNFMTPLVYVEDTNSVIWERSCGTGTAGLGASLAMLRQQSVNLTVSQPGGQLEIQVAWENGRVTDLFLKGEVHIAAEGVVYL